MTEGTAVSESVAKKLCFAGEESGVGFVVARKKKHAENTWKTRGSVGTFPLWHKGKHAKHAKNAVGIGGQKQMHLVRVDAVG